jgi:hypothetical protein
MKIIISESQYKNFLLEYKNLTSDEMEEYFVLYFESLQRYEDMLKKILWVRSYTQIKNVDFYWDPRLNSEDYKSFAYRSSFVKNRRGTLQFSFTYKVEHGVYDGQFNGFVNVQDGMRIYPSIKSRIKEVMGVVNEGLHDTSWQNEKGDKITLIDLLNATEEIPVQKISVEELRPYLLSWDDDPEEIKKIEKADLQYPILIFVTSNGEFISIIDGHHRAQKAARKGLETIKAKVINIDTLPKKIRKVFSHLGNQEEMTEGEITERCWKGYTQKGMKTMFGKRYPNCVKKTK